MLEFASNELRNDNLTVMAAVSNDGLALKYATFELQSDSEIVYTAIHNNGLAI